MVTMACETRNRQCGEPRFSGCHIVRRPPRRCHCRPAGGSVRQVGVGRYYDPQTGQFLSIDQKVQQTQQAYIYAGDDPEDRTDPNGMFNVGFSKCGQYLPGGPKQCASSHLGGIVLIVIRAAKAALKVSVMVGKDVGQTIGKGVTGLAGDVVSCIAGAVNSTSDDGLNLVWEGGVFAGFYALTKVVAAASVDWNVVAVVAIGANAAAGCTSQ